MQNKEAGIQRNNITFNREKTRKLATIGILSAISIILVAFVHFPLFPSASFLEYDPADIPILIGTFVYGPVAGLMLTAIVSILQGLLISPQSGVIGVVMHIIATGSCALVAGVIYSRNKTKKTAVIALAAGSVTMTAAMVIMNMIFTPIFMGVPLEVVIPMLVPIIIPFNLFKALINALLTFILYKKISHILRK